MPLMTVVDYSKWQREVSRNSHRQMRQAGVRAFIPGLWHGTDANSYALNSLANGRAEGLLPGGYIVVVARDGREVVRLGKAAAGSHWKDMFGVAIDIEIAGITEANLANALDEVRVQGQRPFLYTGNWFWSWWRVALGHWPEVGAPDSWIAYYNGIADLGSFPSKPGYGRIIGHQYTGSTSAFGTTVDFNVFDESWLLKDTEPKPAPPPTPAPPVAPPEEGLMGKILDTAIAFGTALEAEVDRAMTLPTPIKGETGKTGATGATGPAGGGTARRTHTVVGGDTLGGIANKYSGVTWNQIYDANKALIGDNPNLIHPGMVLVIPG